MRFYFFALLLTAASVGFFLLIKPILYPIFWAGVIAWLFYPLYCKIQGKVFHNKSIASFITVSCILCIFIIPISGIVLLILQQSIQIYSESEKQITEIYDHIKRFSEQLGDLSFIRLLESSGVDWEEKIVGYVRALSEFIFTGLHYATNGTIRFIVGFFVMLYTLYFFLKDGEWMIKRVLHLSPLDSKSEKIIYEKFTAVIGGTLKGTFLVGLIQGVLAGVIFWIAGIIAPAFWGLIMTILALLPSVGPALLSLPAGLILLIQGKIWQGVFVLVLGVGLVSVVDNFLRPYLVGRDIHMHPLFVFFSTLGGLALFGLSGFIIGPIVASIFIALWTIYEHRFKNELEKN